MNTLLFIAKRLSGSNRRDKISGPIIRINVIGIALGIAVMVISVAIVTGFKNEITNRIIGFGSHIQVTNFDSNNSYQTVPINKSKSAYNELEQIPGVTSVSSFANKYGILKTGKEFHGLVLKGIGPDFNNEFFKRNLVSGQMLELNDSVKNRGIVISEMVAKKLKLSVGDQIGAFFIQEPPKKPRMRRYRITGIYKTSLQDFDKLFALCDIKDIQSLNEWTDDQISGLEIFIDNYKDIDFYTYKVYETAGSRFMEDGTKLKVTNVLQKYPYIFDWLELQDINVWVILILMIIVAGFNLISGLLILILDRTTTIGIMKSFGTDNKQLKRIFSYQASILAFKGLAIGNVIGITFGIIQNKYHIIKLDPTAYFLDSVPVNLTVVNVLLVNAGALVLIYYMLLFPLRVIAKIDPSKAIRFE